MPVKHFTDMGHGEEFLDSGRLQHGMDNARSFLGGRYRPVLDLISPPQKPGFV